jgi:hypothetical protein
VSKVSEAYSLEKLKAKLQKHGGPEAEKFAKANYQAFKEFLVEGAAESDGKIDDIAVPGAFIAFDSVALKVLDQIDGVQGN